MANCKDCIHYEPCFEYGNILDPIHGGVKCDSFKPTADVVPKSEVERAYQRGFERGKRDNVCGFSAEDIARKGEQLAIELEAMRTAANSYKMHYENARDEVAREIFAEIEQLLKRTCEKGYCGSISDLLADLKKKYTEGENQCADERG